MGDWWTDAWNDVGNAFEDAGEAIVGVVEDVGEAIVDVVEDVVEAVVDVAEDVAEVVVDVAEAIGDAAEDVAEWTLNTLDDYVFDTVDYITGGVIDIDYDDGQFSAGLDIGIASVGVSFGDQGFSADASFDVGLASGEISYDSSDGLAMSGSIGVDWGPLPYAEGHMSWGPDGEISIGGLIQGTLPLPGGGISGQLSGEFERNADGSWGATADFDLDASLPSGDLSIDATGSIGVDADGTFSRESDVDVFLDRDGDGINDLDDDVLDGGEILAGGQTSLDDGAGLDILTGESDDDLDLGAALGASVDSYNDLHDSIGQGLTSDPTRIDDDIVAPGGTDNGLDTGGFDAGSGLDAGIGLDAGSGLDAGDGFAPVDDFAAIDGTADQFAPVDSMSDPVMPEPPPPSDFAVEIDTIETVEVEADEMWDDLD